MKTLQNSIGRYAIVVHNNKCYTANILDCVAGSDIPKRVRIQQDIELQGKVLMPSEYTFKQFADEEAD